MPRERCLITSRLAGPCASCRQPAWPAHVQSDGRILCANCCACGRGGAQAVGTDAAPSKPSKAGPGHEALAADRGPAKNMPRIGLPAGASASQAWGKAPDTTQGPARDSGALEALRGPLCAATCSALRPRLAARAATWPPAGPRLGRLDAAASQSVATMPPALAGPASQGQAQVPAALRGKTFLRRNVSAHNFVKQWRFV
jgi:hypothetical protein